MEDVLGDSGIAHRLVDGAWDGDPDLLYQRLFPRYRKLPSLHDSQSSLSISNPLSGKRSIG